MEPHPVPQNIIDVEFKLFGSFTLKQFSKMLIGSLVGVGLFFININPLIKFPLIFASVVIGIGLAIIPNLMVWMIGFLKSIFVSPRYVWVKQPSTPELFAPKSTEPNPANRQEIHASISKRKLNIDELPLNTSFANDDDDDFGQIGNTSSDIFIRAYEQVYGRNASTPPKVTAPGVATAHVKSDERKGFASQFLSRAVQSIDINLLKPKSKELKTRQDYINELETLRVELDGLNKSDFNYDQRYQEIVEKMNSVYTEFKSKVGTNTNVALQPNAPQVVAAQTGKIVNGIIVSKDDHPIGGAEIFLTNLFYNKAYKTVSGVNGRFSTNIPIPQGEYDIRVNKQGMRFHNYKIKIGNQKPPAYKFREK